MKSIQNRLAGDPNVGSLRSIMFLPMDVITGGLPHPVMRPYADKVDVDFITISVEKWFNAEFQFSTAQWEYGEEKQTANGIVYADKITWRVAKDYNFRRADFDDMEHRQYAVFIVDNNGKGTFFGYRNLDGELCGMTFKKKKTTGDKVTDLNYYTLLFSWESPYQAFNGTYTTGPIVEPGHDEGDGPLPLPGDPPEA